MTIAFVINSAIVTGGNGGTSAGINTSTANLIVIGEVGVSAVPTPTDNMGNTYTPLTKAHGPAFGNVTPATRLFYCLNPTVGSGHTFTVTSSGDANAFLALAFSGVSAFDVENAANIIANSAGNGGTLTPTNNNEVIVALVGGDCTPSAIDSSFNFIGGVGVVSGANYGFGIAYLIQTTKSTENPTWTFTAFNSFGQGASANLAAFTASGGATFNPAWAMGRNRIFDGLAN